VSVVAAAGFLAGSAAAGMKPDGAEDVALLVAHEPAVAAAVFTSNVAAAPPVVLSREHAESGRVRAVVLNSGCANAGTGAAGTADARAMAAATAHQVGAAAEEVLVCSTGPIGPRLPIAAVEQAIATAAGRLGDGAASGRAAAIAIHTTDTVAKEAVAAGDGYTVGGMAKGAGMVRPDMATMLAVVTTDARVDRQFLREALVAAVDASFHALNVDGCPSTNDTVIALASGSSGVVPGPAAFTAALTEVCWRLAEQMAADAEGASRVVTIEVSGADDDATARALGRAVADWALVRAAFYGGDPNWGRILGALGSSGLRFRPDRVGVAFQGVAVAAEGVAVDHDAAALQRAMAEGPIDVAVVVGDGPGRARVLTTDLTPDYVVFNGEPS
jgi:glutamate N-acetyltransferase/amino-acid N-acetyltransferase